ncbi:hypothetical protein QWI17_13420 [Gilvimarinus sp. SDUM040013]|uniref:Polysaccharide chain length determinant N-terminal domain-containing protein n=1 Tax=Gilvimarinus gilvus TaxID=3058038 RepID=A0ABU4RZ13_9GAMM|nr:hypothetical protein [Gilvimarinus sp. SDUM040013]MDO3386841.1 hypothetical protein [Gilvimarinus sp. SDUM040013]MDX6848229.1 hypothetical protein [Gilvimarinus sp. SDUM040013]
MQTQDYLRELITIFFIRKKTILGITIAALVLGILIVILYPSAYRANGALILKGNQVLQAQGGSLTDVNAEVNSYGETDLFSEMEILRSQDVIRGAVLRLQDDERFPIDPTDEESLMSMVRDVQKRLATSLVPRSYVIRAAVEWNDPSKATALLDSIFEEYIQQRQTVFNPEETEEFFRNQLDSFRDGLEALENDVIAVSGGAGESELRDRIKQNIEMRGDLRKALGKLEGDLIEKNNYVTFLERSLQEEGFNFFTAVPNLVLGDFSKKIEDLLIEREALLKVYTADNPEVIKSEEQLNRLYDVFKKEAARNIKKEQAELKALQEQASKVETRLEAIDTENRTLYEQSIRAKRLDRERDVMEDSFKTFATRHREAKIRNETKSDHLFTVGVVEQPYARNKAVFPNARNLLPLCLIIGLMLGMTAGFLIEFFDHRFKRPEDVTNYTQVAYLFSVPDYSK